MSDINGMWDMFSKLSNAIHLENKIKELQQMLKSGDECGDCDHWMKSSRCPKEHNVGGYSKGPSMSGMICGKFELKEWVKEFRADKQKEIEALKEELRQQLPKIVEGARS